VERQLQFIILNSLMGYPLYSTCHNL
jgi:hypothetical protein